MYVVKARGETHVLFVDGGNIAEESDSFEALRSLWSLLIFYNGKHCSYKARILP